MILNTVDHFLKTVDATSRGMTSITCPACGSQMGLQQSGSYQNILTPKARDVINSSLSIFSRFLESRDRQLDAFNIFGINPVHSKDYPYKREDDDRPNLKAGGVFEGTEGTQTLYEFIKKYLDYFDAIENMTNFPRIQESENKHISILKKLLLVGAEPRRISGPLVDLIFEQPDVATWMKKHDNSQAIDQLLDEVCPSYQKYLIVLKRLISSEDSPSKKSDLEGLKRVQFILAILLGHKSLNPSNLNTLEGLNMESRVPFLLPRITEVSPKTLFNLLRSDVILNNPEFAWEQSLVTKIRDTKLPENLENFTSNLNNLIEKFGPEIKKFVHFACTGPLNSEENKGEEGGKNLVCGWYPKEEETHTIILLGSAGTGKSTMMMTGLTAFYEYSAGMGAKIIFESPSDEEMMNDLRQQYFAGKLPKPTKKGCTQNIMLSLEFPKQDAANRLYFVFTDIAGQTIARCLTDKGGDSSVKRILKNAETIVAFFDLSIESAFREAFTQGDDERTWEEVKNNYKRVLESRKEDAEISQIQLFNRLLADLQEEKDNGLKETKFLCVIPKADLFVREDNERFFLTPFFEAMREKAMFVRSRQNQSQQGFDGYYSIGGIGSNISQKEGLERQNEIGLYISQVAQNCLKNIGKALGDEPDFKPLADSLYYKLKTNLFDNLSEIFSDDNVYYLPVSAQGKDIQQDPNEEGYVKLDNPPNQKLAEYVFMLPISWAAQSSNSPAGSEPEPPNSPRSTFNF